MWSGSTCSHDTHERHRERVAPCARVRGPPAGPRGGGPDGPPGPQDPHRAVSRRAHRPGRRRRLRHRCRLPPGSPATAPGSVPPIPSLADDVHPGDTLLLDDGAIELRVESVVGWAHRLHVVLAGGKLSNNKGINKKGGGLSAPALTDKDKDDIRFAAETWRRLSGRLLRAQRRRRATWRGSCSARPAGEGGIVAKIERAEALNARRRHHPRRRRHHGRPRRPGRGDRRRRAPGGAEAPDQPRPRAQQRRHHRHPDDAVHDREPHPDPGRGLRRGQRGPGRHRCGHALRRVLRRQVPGQGGGGPGPHLLRGGEDTSPAPGIASTRSSAGWTRASPWPPCTPPITWG